MLLVVLASLVRVSVLVFTDATAAGGLIFLLPRHLLSHHLNLLLLLLLSSTVICIPIFLCLLSNDRQQLSSLALVKHNNKQQIE